MPVVHLYQYHRNSDRSGHSLPALRNPAQSGGRCIGDVTELRISDRECAAPAVGQAVMDDFVPDHFEPDCADYIRSIFFARAHD